MRIAIAEDVALLREGIVRLLLERGHEVVAEISDAREILKTAKDLQPDTNSLVTAACCSAADDVGRTRTRDSANLYSGADLTPLFSPRHKQR